MTMTDADYQAQIADLTTAARLHRDIATDLRGRINRARMLGHIALGNVEGAHVAALATALADVMRILEGDK